MIIVIVIVTIIILIVIINNNNSTNNNNNSDLLARFLIGTVWGLALLQASTFQRVDEAQKCPLRRSDIYIYTHRDTYIHIYIYIHTYVYIYIYIYTHTYIYIYIYIYMPLVSVPVGTPGGPPPLRNRLRLLFLGPHRAPKGTNTKVTTAMNRRISSRIEGFPLE